MPTRRRSPQEFEATESKLGPQTVTLQALAGGYNGYTNPELLSPQFWALASQCYSGQFGSIRRARFAPIFNSAVPGYSANGFRIVSMTSFTSILPPIPWLMFENNDTVAATGPRWLIKYPISGFSYGTIRGATSVQPVLDVWQAQVGNFNGFPLSFSLFNGPYSRTTINNLILEGNNLFRSKLILGGGILYNATVDTGVPILTYWGIDAPDVSPAITPAAGLSATIQASPTGAVRANNVATITTTAPHGFTTGQYATISGVTDTTFNSLTGATQQITVTGASTFTYPNIGTNGATSGSGTATVQITKTVGRSYQYAWENANTGHISAPSPASQFVKYNNQTGTVDCIESGTIAAIINSTTVTGTGTQFSSAWVGKALWVESAIGALYPTAVYVVSVSGPTTMTVSKLSSQAYTGERFQVIDPQCTHVRLYETGDGGSIYFRTARNSLLFTSQGTIAASGFEFVDTSNSEPPNAPFTSEIAQNFNVPPPIGQFVADYQGRPIVFGVPGALQSFFYGGIETVVVGQPPESFPPLNQVTLPVGDGQLLGWANLPTGAIIWSNRYDMFKLTGLLTDNTVSNPSQLGATIQRLPYRLGSGSAYANTVTNMGVFWLTSDRQVQLFTDHYAPKDVGKPIQDILNRINGRIGFAKMKNYKRGERNWLVLAISLDNSTFNNKLCILDLDLLASNGQPSFFTFDMATNQPSWYLYDINCESIESAVDALNQNHLLCGDVDLITDADYHPPDFTVTGEVMVPGGTVTLHALGNDAPEVVKSVDWLRANTNQLPANIATQGWTFGILQYDDEQWVVGVTNSGNLVSLVPGVNSSSVVTPLENSPADFRLNGAQFAKGRRFQFQVNFPSIIGNWEFRGFQLKYTNLYER